jgi:hypothetical protein
MNKMRLSGIETSTFERPPSKVNLSKGGGTKPTDPLEWMAGLPELETETRRAE